MASRWRPEWSTSPNLARRPIFAGCPQHGADDPDHRIMAAASVVFAQLRISPGHARSRVELACELVEALPDTLEALSIGRIDGYRARVLAEETRPLANNPALRAEVERELLVKLAAFWTAIDAAARRTRTEHPTTRAPWTSYARTPSPSCAGPPSRSGTWAAATPPADTSTGHWAPAAVGPPRSTSPCPSPR
jgi:Domain of unknown function (DUF222)